MSGNKFGNEKFDVNAEFSKSAVEPVVSVPMPDGMIRPETGVMQFGDDWQGCFVRGDDCHRIAFDMESASELIMDSDPIKAVLLKSYAEFFRSCKEH